MDTTGHQSDQTQPDSATTQGQQAAAVLVTLALVVHFGLILVHAGPTHALQARFALLADSYATPFFTQDWQLFAPDPIVTEEELLVRWRAPGGPPGEYVSITEPYVNDRRHNLLPNKTIYAINGPLTMYKNDLAAVADYLYAECGDSFTEDDFFVSEQALQCLFDFDSAGAQALAYSRYDLLYVAAWHLPAEATGEAHEFQVRLERRMPALLGDQPSDAAGDASPGTESAWLKVSDYRGG